MLLVILEVVAARRSGQELLELQSSAGIGLRILTLFVMFSPKPFSFMASPLQVMGSGCPRRISTTAVSPEHQEH